jgi:hypothetical protein
VGLSGARLDRIIHSGATTLQGSSYSIVCSNRGARPEWLAPVVRIKRTGRYVFLLAWERDKHGRWRGHGAWLAREQVAWRGVDVWMLANDLERVGGEDYRRVPKRFADDSPF